MHSSREILNPTTSYSIFDIRSPPVLYCHLVNSLENHWQYHWYLWLAWMIHPVFHWCMFHSHKEKPLQTWWVNRVNKVNRDKNTESYNNYERNHKRVQNKPTFLRSRGFFRFCISQIQYISLRTRKINHYCFYPHNFEVLWTQVSNYCLNWQDVYIQSE